ncbi:MAG: DUF5692 family protein [bacterium]|nr:DUF5692 family protein [bacterium]
MFFFESISLYQALMWVAVVVLLIVFNEVTRKSKWAALGCFVVLPLILTMFVWPKTAGAGSSTGTWFHWVKVYSALAGCIGFYVIRFKKGAVSNKYWLVFPPAILAINISEAVIRDFQCLNLTGMVDGVMMVGGPWNIMNGIAGILNILALCGWGGIYISKKKSKDMIWPDMFGGWIIAYDIWNFAYVYNCVSDHAFYAGLALLIAPTLVAFTVSKGAWLQHRAHTLAAWMMFTMAFPAFVGESMFSVSSSHNTTALFLVSAISLAANVALIVYHCYRIVIYKKNIIKDEIYVGTSSYNKIIEQA